MRKIALFIYMSLLTYVGFGACPSGNIASDVTISANCTISTSLTITGNLTISSGSTLTINSGVVVTVTGYLQSAYQPGAVTINGGGTLNVGGRFFNQVRTTTSFTFSNVTVSVNNTSGTTVMNDFTGRLNLLNGTIFTVKQGGFENDNQTLLTINNSSLILTSGSFLNDDHASLQVLNGGAITLNNGNFITEDGSDFNVNASNIYIKGNFNNDYGATLTVANNSTFVVTGNFTNGYNPSGTLVNAGHLTVNNSSLSVGGNFSNGYGSDVAVAGGGSLAVTGSVTNDNTASIAVADGSFSYGGTLTGNTGGVTSSTGGTCTSGCCGSGCGSLPVELLYFKAAESDGEVTISWATASEINNDYFVISRSINGIDYEEIGKVTGAGSSNDKSNYSFIDRPTSGQSFYYQLSQYDFDGTLEVFDPVRLQLSKGALNTELKVYPVPLGSGQNLTIIRNLDGSEKISARITDLSGRISMAVKIEVNGHMMFLLTDQLNLESGLYVIDLAIDQNHYLHKILVK